MQLINDVKAGDNTVEAKSCDALMNRKRQYNVLVEKKSQETSIISRKLSTIFNDHASSFSICPRERCLIFDDTFDGGKRGGCNCYMISPFQILYL